MKRPLLTVALAVAIVVPAGGCRSSRASGPGGDQADFGVRMAKMNLWREAMFRFRRAVELNPQDAMAYNNLAVAYEANGDFENAGKAYREAMRLDKTNQHIQKNYSRFVEFTTRDRRRQRRPPATQAAAAPATTEAAPPAAEPEPSASAPSAPAEPPPAEGTEPPPAPGEDPSPTSAAPAATPAPNPNPDPAPPPEPPAPPPGGER